MIEFIFKYRWAQEEVGVALGVLTEGSIEKCNQDVKLTNTRFVARTSMENIHRNTLTRSFVGSRSSTALRGDSAAGELFLELHFQ